MARQEAVRTGRTFERVYLWRERGTEANMLYGFIV